MTIHESELVINRPTRGPVPCPHCGVYQGQYHDPTCPNWAPNAGDPQAFDVGLTRRLGRFWVFLSRLFGKPFTVGRRVKELDLVGGKGGRRGVL